ncbi:hypothetical protein AN478_06330 [Thiohalorhabdus denitrificans]|uniref:Phosphate-selective porin O and P n=1 Tax=Thiohalorhabdus denitrificans TaxID=381306 RepID=A0A0P9C6F1_9GAMM|nr:hypothetical protein [Thiohalorhabdus denitrificans]KPV40412.1 hypothetical protein AN478_06330 [Thiohalorhabdus denitrificans]SCY60043.1 hypothetical protein SAMN05661077_2629 [Thiohalorhabdus denitrificans]
MGMSISRALAASVLGAGALGLSAPAGAANWLVLTSSEPAEDPAGLRLFGFMQPTYRYIDDGDKPDLAGTLLEGAAPDGNRPIFNTLSPDRSSNQGFNLFRARVGARGALHAVDDDIHYFFLTEWGNNGITRLADPGNDSASPQLTDASVTLRHFAGGGSDDIWEPGVSLRFGQFQWPVADEALRGIMAFDYINFSEVTRQQVNERFVRANQSIDGTKDLTGFDGSISSYRDIGAMAFDEMKVADHWEATWAAGVGNGNGINRTDNDDNMDVYLRAQTAYVFDGVKRGGPRREDLKLFAWAQMGERQFDADGNGVFDADETYDRNRYGAGFHFYRQPYRLSGEYIWGNGMVYNGTTPPVSDPGTGFQDIGDVQPQMAPGEDNEFYGWYLEGAYFPIPNKLAVQARYDYLDRLSSTGGGYTSADEREFETLTLGLQYWNHPVKSQWQLNYRIRSLEAPHKPVADKVGAAMGNEIGLQYFLLFNSTPLR